MADTQLNIILKLLDEATAEIKKSLEGVSKETDKTKKKQEEVNKVTKSGWEKATTAVRNFRKNLLLVTIAIGSAAAVTKIWADRNAETRDSLDEIGLAAKNVFGTLGKLISPLVNKIGEMAKSLNQGFDTGVGAGGEANLDKATNAIKRFNDELKNQQTLFIAGTISAQQYHDKIVESQMSGIANNQLLAGQISQIAALESQIADSRIMNEQRVNQEKLMLLQEYQQNYMIAHQGMKAFTAQLSDSIRNNLSTAITSLATGASTAREAFTNLGKAMIETIISFISQKLIAAALEKTLLAGTVAAAAVAGPAVAAAWAPAALVANIASFGGAGAAAAASFTTAAAVLSASMAASVAAASGATKFHSGGIIRAHEGLAVDEVPIIAQTGEGVLSRRGMAALGGESNLNRLNQGEGAGGGINVNVYYPKMSSREEVDNLANALGIEIERQLRYART